MICSCVSENCLLFPHYEPNKIMQHYHRPVSLASNSAVLPFYPRYFYCQGPPPSLLPQPMFSNNAGREVNSFGRISTFGHLGNDLANASTNALQGPIGVPGQIGGMQNLAAGMGMPSSVGSMGVGIFISFICLGCECVNTQLNVCVCACAKLRKHHISVSLALALHKNSKYDIYGCLRVAYTSGPLGTNPFGQNFGVNGNPFLPGGGAFGNGLGAMPAAAFGGMSRLPGSPLFGSRSSPLASPFVSPAMRPAFAPSIMNEFPPLGSPVLGSPLLAPRPLGRPAMSFPASVFSALDAGSDIIARLDSLSLGAGPSISTGQSRSV
jgi:hypothetical protein